MKLNRLNLYLANYLIWNVITISQINYKLKIIDINDYNPPNVPAEYSQISSIKYAANKKIEIANENKLILDSDFKKNLESRIIESENSLRQIEKSKAYLSWVEEKRRYNEKFDIEYKKNQKERKERRKYSLLSFLGLTLSAFIMPYGAYLDKKRKSKKTT